MVNFSCKGSPLAFIERLAALVLLPRRHQLIYHDVLAPPLEAGEDRARTLLGRPRRLVLFITDPCTIERILVHLGIGPWLGAPASAGKGVTLEAYDALAEATRKGDPF